eukprot:m.46423 g.46423  ORF g.46423 m.46423 type:complete len:53 (+) comp8761_c0_seq1:806-964(+)
MRLFVALITRAMTVTEVSSAAYTIKPPTVLLLACAGRGHTEMHVAIRVNAIA